VTGFHLGLRCRLIASAADDWWTQTTSGQTWGCPRGRPARAEKSELQAAVRALGVGHWVAL
jgi:hypothetical protein